MFSNVIQALDQARANLFRKSVDDVLDVFVRALSDLEKTQIAIQKDIQDLDVEIQNLQSVRSVADTERARADSIRKKLIAFLK